LVGEVAADRDVGLKIALGLIARVGRHLLGAHALDAESRHDLGGRLSLNDDK
jgi:hypothetical protein